MAHCYQVNMVNMLATLPMYDFAEIRQHTDRLWHEISRRLGEDIPLDRSRDYTYAWKEPILLFSQICGFPFIHEFYQQLAYIATPHYAAEGCDGPNYCSLLFAIKNRPLEDFRGLRAAVNSVDSMSGMLALKLMVAPYAIDRKFFHQTILSRSHVNSLLALQQGRADVCAVDAVTVALIRRHRPELLTGLHMIAQSPKVPGLPFVTNIGGVAVIQNVLKDVFADGQLGQTRAALFLSGMTILPPDAYEIIADHQRRMQGPQGVDLFC